MSDAKVSPCICLAWCPHVHKSESISFTIEKHYRVNLVKPIDNDNTSNKMIMIVILS